jgi:hypothetical protein
LKLVTAVSPSIFVLGLTLFVSFVTGHPEGLFLTRSIRGIPTRFVLVTLIVVLPIFAVPKFLALVGRLGKNEKSPVQLVRGFAIPHQEFSKAVDWVFRPLQGIALSLLFAEKFLDLLEVSVGPTIAALLARASLFVIGSALVSLFLAVVWTLDDLGVKIYSLKTGEVRMVGTSVGTILPLLAAAIGISGLFHLNSPLDALLELVEIAAVLYPSYLCFVIAHHEFIKKRSAVLSEKIPAKRVETKIL